MEPTGTLANLFQLVDVAGAGGDAGTRPAHCALRRYGVETPERKDMAGAGCRRGGRRGAVRRRPRSRGRLISDRASSGTPFALLPLDEAEVEGHLPRKHEPPPVDRQDGRPG